MGTPMETWNICGMGDTGTPRVVDVGTTGIGDMGTLRAGDVGAVRVHGDAYGIGDPQGWGHGDLQGSWGHLWDQGPSGMGT